MTVLTVLLHVFHFRAESYIELQEDRKKWVLQEVNSNSRVRSSPLTCDHVIHRAHFEQQPLNEANLSAGLQVSDTLAQYGGEHAPDFRLARDFTVFQQLQHADDGLGILDDEVHFQVKLTTNQLEQKGGLKIRRRERNRMGKNNK